MTDSSELPPARPRPEPSLFTEALRGKIAVDLIELERPDGVIYAPYGWDLGAYLELLEIIQEQTKGSCPPRSSVEATGWVARAPRSTRWSVIDEPEWYRENGWDVAAFGQPETQTIECEECSGVGHTGIDGDKVYDCPACLGEGKLTPLREAQWKLEGLGAEYDHAKSLFDNHRAELDDISAAIGTTRFMDPPDGGYVPLATQVRRMREALEKAEGTLLLYRQAVRIDMTIQGPKFGGVNGSAFKRAYDTDEGSGK